MNVINLLWAFNFKKSRDPATGQDKVYDTHDFVRVRSFLRIESRKLMKTVFREF